jgi:hypothetical protein
MNSMAFSFLANSNPEFDKIQIPFGTIDFQPHHSSFTQVFESMDQDMDLTIGSLNFRVGSLGCGDPGLPPRIPVMHTIHDPRKTVMNPHNRVGIIEYIIHYINKSFSLTWPLGQIQMPRRASSLNIAANHK